MSRSLDQFVEVALKDGCWDALHPPMSFRIYAAKWMLGVSPDDSRSSQKNTLDEEQHSDRMNFLFFETSTGYSVASHCVNFVT